MSIKRILETPNKEFPDLSAVQEIMNIKIPKIINGIPNRNGFIWLLCGSAGSGKSSLLLNFFRTEELYLKKFNHLFYICPESSFLSVKNHPFESHDKVYHQLNSDVLSTIFDKLSEIKESTVEKKKKIQYSCVIIDDYANQLKDPDILQQLNKMLIKARHLCCAFIFTVQSFFYYPKILRKQLTNITIFKPKSKPEWDSIADEILNMKKDDALKLYKYIFDEPYSHLDIDTVSDQKYKNFNLLTFVSE